MWCNTEWGNTITISNCHKLIQLNNCPVEVVLQWLPGHSSLSDNDLVDLESISYVELQLSLRVSSQTLLEHTREWLQSTATTVCQLILKMIMAGRKSKELLLVLLAQICSGHCHLFRAYKHLIDSTTDPTCRVCGEASDTMEHWLLGCPALSRTRTEIFGCHVLNLDVLATSLKQVIALAGRTLVYCIDVKKTFQKKTLKNVITWQK